MRRVEVHGPTELTVQLGADEGPDPRPPGALVERLPGHSGSSRQRFEVVVDGWRFEVMVEPARHADLRGRAAQAAADHRPAAGTILRAQIPGRITRVWVRAGEAVEQGQRLVAVEAMKMENEVRAPQAGIVEAVEVSVGSRVERDDVLMRLGPAGPAT